MNEKRFCMKGAAEFIILWRLGILREIADEFKPKLRVVFMPSDRNEKTLSEGCCVAQEEVKEL